MVCVLQYPPFAGRVDFWSSTVTHTADTDDTDDEYQYSQQYRSTDANEYVFCSIQCIVL